MIDEIKNLVSKRGEFQYEITNMQNEMQKVDQNILRLLVDNQAYDMFSINWSRLRKMLDRMAGHRN